MQQLTKIIALSALCGLLTQSPSTAAAVEQPSIAGISQTATSAAFSELSKLRVDKAIGLFIGPLVETSKKNLRDEQSKQQLARYFALIGRSLALDDNMVAAAQTFLIAHRLQPKNAAYTAYLAEAWWKIGRDADAQPLFKEVQANAATDIASARTHVHYFVRKDCYAEAQSEALKVMKLPAMQKDWLMHHLLGRVYIRRGYTELGVTEYRKSAALSPDKYAAELIMATSYGFERKLEKQEEHLREAGKVAPEDGLWRSNLAYCIGPERKKEYQDLLRESTQSPRFVAKAFYAFANNSIPLNIDNAKGALAELQRRASWQNQTYLLEIKILRKEKQFELAKQKCADLIARHPHFTGAYTVTADLYTELKDNAKVIETLKKCVSQIPGFENGWRRLGDDYFAEGRFDDALPCYQKALSLMSHDYKNLNELANNELSGVYSGLGCYHYVKGDKIKAFDFADKCNQSKFVPVLPWYFSLIQIRPGHIDWRAMSKKDEQEAAKHAILADMLRQKRVQDCIAEYRKATELNPDEVNYHTYLLDALSESGDWMGAAGEDWQASSKMINKLPSQFGKMFSNKSDKTSQDDQGKGASSSKPATPHLIPEIPGRSSN